MIIVRDKVITAPVTEIIQTLKTQLEQNGVHRFYKTIISHNNIMVCCPFHKNGQERKPSMGILETDGTCHCFACGWVGSLTRMISLCWGYDDLGQHGEKWLMRTFISASISERSALYFNFGRSENVPPKQYVTEDELEAYRYTHSYLYGRGMTDEIIETFDLGYDENTDSITFPVRDITGNTLFIARRSVKYKYYSYPAGVTKPLYGLYELSKIWKGEYRCDEIPESEMKQWVPGGSVIVCEGMFDALTCWVYGKPAVALNGLGSDLQFKQLNELPCRELILATDMDVRGLLARTRIRKNVPNKLITEYKWDIEVAKDINDMSKEYFDSLTPFM